MLKFDQETTIQDPIHGQIKLSAFETAVINHLDFQRLRFIRQTSLLHYVFPGAFHTRFAHSIGACHNSQLVLRQLFPNIRFQSQIYALQVFRFAALLHDVGHGAFSHSLSHLEPLGETFLPAYKKIFKNIENWVSEPDSNLVVELKSEFKDSEKIVDHEILSVFIVDKIFRSLSQDLSEDFFMGFDHEIWVRDISSLLASEIMPSKEFLKSLLQVYDACRGEFVNLDSEDLDLQDGAISLQKALKGLISGTIDVDRMDYLQRDSLSCGVNYGVFDKEGIISALKLAIKEGQVYLALKSKRTNTLDDYLWSRYQMFRQIYGHKTHSAYDLLLSLAMGDLIRSEQLKSPESLAEYLQLTDDYIMSMVILEAQKHPHKSNWIRAFAHRKLPKFLGLYEGGLKDPLAAQDPKEIYKNLDFEKYSGWEGDENFVSISRKSEIIKNSDSPSTLPLVIYFDKNQNKFLQQSYLEKSVFFDSQLEEKSRLNDLVGRLNKKNIYFYSLDHPATRPDSK